MGFAAAGGVDASTAEVSPGFPIHRDLIAFDWTETPLPQAQMEQLATGSFMEAAHNLILVGGTGTGLSSPEID